METLSVYDDYMQTMAFLRASRNRLFNTETSNMIDADTKECWKICDKLYQCHTNTGMRAIQAAHRIGVENVARATDAVKACIATTGRPRA